MLYQVGKPLMFDGNRFFALTGMPMWNKAFTMVAFAVCEPEPLTVATLIVKSLITGLEVELLGRS